MDQDAYLLEPARYIVLNPVRAGMVADALAWPWCSYRAVVGECALPTWLATDALLAQFAATRGRARQLYIDHVRAGVGLPSAWEGLVSQMFLGGEVFLERMQALAARQGDVLEIPRAQRRPNAEPLARYAMTCPRPGRHDDCGLRVGRLHAGAYRSAFWRAFRNGQSRGCSSRRRLDLRHLPAVSCYKIYSKL